MVHELEAVNLLAKPAGQKALLKEVCAALR